MERLPLGRDGLFYHPDFKYGFAPGELRALFFNRQEVRWYRSEFIKMRAELERLQANTWATQKLRENVLHRLNTNSTAAAALPHASLSSAFARAGFP